MTEHLRQRIAELEEALRPFAQVAEDVLREADGDKYAAASMNVNGCFAGEIYPSSFHRAASLLSQSVPEAQADGDDVERVAQAILDTRLWPGAFKEGKWGGHDAECDDVREQARAALAAMPRPAVDRERLAEIRERHANRSRGSIANDELAQTHADCAWLMSELLKMIGPLTKGDGHE